MNNNQLVVVEDSQFEIIQSVHKQEIMSVYDGIYNLIDECNNFVIDVNNKESYKEAEELKRKVKRVHISIKEKGAELKIPIKNYIEKLDEFVLSIYNPLREAELNLKATMDNYKEQLNLIKQQNLIEQQETQRRKDELEQKLIQLNSKLAEINSAQNLDELQNIDNYLEALNLSEFGDKSAEAGFVLANLKATSKMARKMLSVVQKEVVSESESNKVVAESEEKEIAPDTDVKTNSFVDMHLNVIEPLVKEAVSESESNKVVAESDTKEAVSESESNKVVAEIEMKQVASEKEQSKSSSKKVFRELNIEEKNELIEITSKQLYDFFLKTIDVDLSKHLEKNFEIDLFIDIDMYRKFINKVTKNIANRLIDLANK